VVLLSLNLNERSVLIISDVGVNFHPIKLVSLYDDDDDDDVDNDNNIFITIITKISNFI
jgi:hypothetical protein